MKPAAMRKRAKRLLGDSEIRMHIVLALFHKSVREYKSRYKKHNNADPPQEYLALFIESSKNAIYTKADEVIDDLIEKLVPESNIFYYIKNSGLLLVFIVPCLYSAWQYFIITFAKIIQGKGDTCAFLSMSDVVTSGIAFFFLLLLSAVFLYKGFTE